MCSPCYIDWIYPTQKQGGKKNFFVMLKYTLHTFTLISSDINWVHVTSVQLQPNKILINIYNKILNLDMQVYYCISHPQKFPHNCPKGTNWISGKNYYGQWGHNRNPNPRTHSLTS